MREILFRGKRENGEWIYGLPYECDGTIDCIRVKESIENIIAYISYKVIPETVGQYTGLTDKNGKKIFEGDIVRISERGKVVNGKIIFKNAYNGGWLVADKTEQSSCSLAMRNNVEVIGNIHDNPELMEEGAE